MEWLEAKEGLLQTQLLRKDFDLAHTQALKAILDDKVLFLERSVEDLDVTARERVRDQALRWFVAGRVMPCYSSSTCCRFLFSHLLFVTFASPFFA